MLFLYSFIPFSLSLSTQYQNSSIVASAVHWIIGHTVVSSHYFVVVLLQDITLSSFYK